MSKLPDFVIIGAAKSASTWLHLALRQHPAVYMPADETEFFDDVYYNANDLGPLFAQLKGAPAGAVVGIKCPNYLCTPQCVPRLAQHLPQARLVAILRNPVDRAISQYYHLIRAGQLPVVPADIAFSHYLAGRFDPPYARRLVMDFGRYAMGLENFRRVFPSEQLLVLTDLDMRSSSLGVLQRVCRFLEIEPTSVPMGVSVPRNQGVYFVPFLRFIHFMNQHGQIYDAASGLARPRPGPLAWSAGRLALFGSRLSAATRIFVRPQEPAVSAQTRAALLEFYLPDIVRLEGMTNMDLSAWKQRTANAA
jgi:Sulfotransferase family